MHQRGDGNRLSLNPCFWRHAVRKREDVHVGKARVARGVAERGIGDVGGGGALRLRANYVRIAHSLGVTPPGRHHHMVAARVCSLKLKLVEDLPRVS